MIQAINISPELLKEFIINDTDTHLINLSKINIFAGENNSGKSRFLRGLMKYNSTNYIDYTSADESFFKYEIRTLRAIKATFEDNRSQGFIYSKQDEIYDKIDKIIQNRGNVNLSIQLYYQLQKLDEKDFSFPKQAYNPINWNNQLDFFKMKSSEILNRINSFNKKIISKDIIYIPTLRGLRPISDNFSIGNDNYRVRTVKDYFSKSQNKETPDNIFTGLSLYENIMSMLLGTEEQRELIRGFQKFISESIFKKSITLIPRYKDDVLHIKIGNDPQFEIYNLGDGIQSLITILFPIYINKDFTKIVFIEEPETHLHPKWQKVLTKALSAFTEHIFFISTHSSSFINQQESQTYSFNKIGSKFIIKHLESKTSKIQLLNELGYEQSDLLQTNYVLWVEGPSDKIYFNYWIKKIAPELLENIHYTILFYGGQTLSHLIEPKKYDSLECLLSINQNSGIYIDSDRTNKNEKYNLFKKELKVKLLKESKFCWLSQKREIENYIPMSIFEKSVKSVYEFEDIKIDTGEFADRCKVMRLNDKPHVKQKIRLPDEFFSYIQKNGTIKGIKAKILKDNIEKALEESKSNTFTINKIHVASKVISQKPEITDKELDNQLKRLVSFIKKANLTY